MTIEALRQRARIVEVPVTFLTRRGGSRRSRRACATRGTSRRRSGRPGSGDARLPSGSPAAGRAADHRRRGRLDRRTRSLRGAVRAGSVASAVRVRHAPVPVPRRTRSPMPDPRAWTDGDRTSCRNTDTGHHRPAPGPPSSDRRSQALHPRVPVASRGRQADPAAAAAFARIVWGEPGWAMPCTYSSSAPRSRSPAPRGQPRQPHGRSGAARGGGRGDRRPPPASDRRRSGAASSLASAGADPLGARHGRRGAARERRLMLVPDAVRRRRWELLARPALDPTGVPWSGVGSPRDVAEHGRADVVAGAAAGVAAREGPPRMQRPPAARARGSRVSPPRPELPGSYRTTRAGRWGAWFMVLWALTVPVAAVALHRAGPDGAELPGPGVRARPILLGALV